MASYTLKSHTGESTLFIIENKKACKSARFYQICMF